MVLILCNFVGTRGIQIDTSSCCCLILKMCLKETSRDQNKLLCHQCHKRIQNLIMFESILLHIFIFCQFKHVCVWIFIFTRRCIRGLCYASRGGHCFIFSGLNLIFVSVKEFVIAIIICKMKNHHGFFYQTECYVIILYTCVCIINLNVDILWDGCIFKICWLNFHFLFYEVCMWNFKCVEDWHM